jgi:hypothetical protein
VVFEPAILVVEGPQIYILDRMATGIGHVKWLVSVMDPVSV